MTDIFVPAAMSPRVQRSDTTWIRVFARLNDGASVGPLRARLHAIARSLRGRAGERVHRHEPGQHRSVPRPNAGARAGRGRSLRAAEGLRPLAGSARGIDCARAADCFGERRESDDRAGIGTDARNGSAGFDRCGTRTAGPAPARRGRAPGGGRRGARQVVHLWATPFVVSQINPPGNPARLSLPVDWRVFGFGVTLTFIVTLLFGLVPALRASAVSQASALKSGADARSRRRVMHGVIAAQSAFCFLVLFAGGLFVATSSGSPDGRSDSTPNGSSSSMRFPPLRNHRWCGRKSPITFARSRVSSRWRWPDGRCPHGAPGMASFGSKARRRVRPSPISSACPLAG